MQQITLIVMSLALLATSSAAQAKMMIFGGEGHDEYLGCLDCSAFSSDSICNDYGPYGNEYSSKGLFNEYAGFGNEYSSKSPWNEYSLSKSVPVVVDENGKFYGYLTINAYRHDAVDFASQLAELYEAVDGDLEKVRKGLCEAFGG